MKSIYGKNKKWESRTRADFYFRLERKFVSAAPEVDYFVLLAIVLIENRITSKEIRTPYVSNRQRAVCASSYDRCKIAASVG